MCKKKSCFWGHTWSNWTQYGQKMWSTTFNRNYIENRQTRHCEVCNKVQDKAI